MMAFMRYLILCAGAAISILQANPQNMSVASGEAQMIENGTLMEINVSDRAVLNWDSFSIGVEEITRFVQPSIDSAVLNRVTGTQISELMGMLQANGQVYLANPNGVIVGKEGRIDTAAFIATTMELKNQDFLNCEEIAFFGESPGEIVNLGTIQTSSGPVVLFGHRVENCGEILASGGNVSIASGNEIFFDPTGDSLLFIQSPLHEETVPAISLAIGGAIDSVKIVEEGGNIFIRSANGIEISENAQLTAAEGGNIFIQSDGLCEAKGEMIAPSGEVRLLGERVHLLENAKVDVSGDQKGGILLVGGDYQGANPEIPNATSVYIGPGVMIDADAKLSGHGGKVILWGNQSNIFYGAITAQGGKESGDGGFVEISSKGGFIPAGTVKTLAPNGKTGMLLLDPADVTISTAADSNNTGAMANYVFTGTPANVNSANLVAFLAGSDVTIDTSSGGVGGGTGTIDVTADLSWSASNLSLTADSDITITGTMTVSGTGNLTTTTGGGGGNLVLNGPINWSSSNNVELASNANIDVTADITVTSNAGCTLSAQNDLTISGATITLSGSGSLSLLSTAAGSLNFTNCTIDTQTAQTFNPDSGIALSGTVNFNTSGTTTLQGGTSIFLTTDTTVNTTASTISFAKAISGPPGNDTFTLRATSGSAEFTGANLANFFDIETASNFSLLSGSMGAGDGSTGISITAGGAISIGASASLSNPAGANTPITLSAGTNISLASGITIQADGAILLKANQNITAVTSGTIKTIAPSANDVTLVVDNQFPSSPNFGNGAFTFPSGFTLSTPSGGKVLLYASKPGINTFPSTINGEAYTAGSFSGSTYTTGTNEFLGFWYPQLPVDPVFEVIYKFSNSSSTTVPTGATAQTLQTATVEAVNNSTQTQQITQIVQGTLQTSAAPEPSAPCRTPSVAVQAL